MYTGLIDPEDETQASDHPRLPIEKSHISFQPQFGRAHVFSPDYEIFVIYTLKQTIVELQKGNENQMIR